MGGSAAWLAGQILTPGACRVKATRETLMARGFETTQWSVVLAVGSDDRSASRRALATLCETYWCPLYAYVRRRGHSPEDAEDR